ncbi:hypothetical protein AgCh_025821 [Apium graveolens]
MAEEAQIKLWEGKVCAKLRGPKAETIWAFLKDFGSIHKWLPGIDTCYEVEGVDGQPGLVRYCGTTITSPSNESITLWCHEKLIAIDENQRTLSYEIIANNMGMKMYKATIKVVPVEGGDDESGCEIKWLFVAEPVESWTYEAFMSYIESSIHGMAQKMERALQSTN